MSVDSSHGQLAISCIPAECRWILPEPIPHARCADGPAQEPRCADGRTQEQCPQIKLEIQRGGENDNSLKTFLWPPCSGRKGAGSPELQSALAALERDIQFETNSEVRRAEEAAQQYPWERINEPVPDYLDE